MESYRARGKVAKPAQQLLLPLSFGPSSTSLLYLLDQQLKGQFDRMGRTSYELHVVHVDLHTQESYDAQETLERMNKIKDIFPKHTYSTIGIEESLNLPSIEWSSLDLPNPSSQGSIPLKSRFQALLNSLPSPTSRSDITYTLLTRLLVSQAQTHNCTSILFGDSTTRLAERTLISTAAGRGFSLPWLVSDGPSPYPTQETTTSTPSTQPLNFHYPLRDVLKKELITFTKLLINANPALSNTIIYEPSLKHISASNKATTIDDLMIQYFESVEENYPSIVANVVRTSSKLVAGPTTTSSSENETKNKSCGICGFPVEAGTDGIFGWGGDQNDTSVLERGHEGVGILCYGCWRSVNG